MKIRMDFVTNSSSSSYVLAVVNSLDFDNFIEKILKVQDLGTSWHHKLSCYVGRCTTADLETTTFGCYGYPIIGSENIEYAVDKTMNIKQDTPIYWAEIYSHGDYEMTVEEVFLRDAFRSGELGEIILETYPYEI